MSYTDYVMEDWSCDPRNYGFGDEDAPDGEFASQGPIPKTCNKCGEGGLSWSFSDKGRWRLSRRGVIHICDPNRVARREFGKESAG